MHRKPPICDYFRCKAASGRELKGGERMPIRDALDKLRVSAVSRTGVVGHRRGSRGGVRARGRSVS